jgi:hypothetical protein
LKSPLSDPDTAKPDDQLFGVWRPLKKDNNSREIVFVLIGKSGRVDAPPGIMKHVCAGIDAKNAISVDDDNVYFFTTTVGESRYASLFEKTVFDRTKFPKWDKRNIKEYTLVKYKVEMDQLTVWLMDEDAAEAAIRKGQVKGTVTAEKRGSSDKKKVITLTDGESLSKYLSNGGDKALFPDNEEHKLAFLRVKG